MRKVFCGLAFILAFQLEVRVRASAEQLVQEPSQCLRKSDSSCALQAGKGGFHLTQGDLRWHLANGSAVIRESSARLEFVKGHFWLEKSKTSFEVQTVYGQVTSLDGGGFWIFEKNGQLWIRNLDASLSIKTRTGQSVSLPEGFEVWLGALNSGGVASVGVPRAINLSEVMGDLAKMYQGSKKDFISQVTYFRDRWGDLSHRSAQLYELETRRELASQAAEEAKENERVKRLNKEKEQRRQLFLERALGR